MHESNIQEIINMNRIKVAVIGCGTIANSVGYADSFVFSKAFKKRYGLSPTTYAKQFR